MTKAELELQVARLQKTVDEQANVIEKTREAVENLNKRATTAEKERDVLRVLAGEKAKAMAINPDNIQSRIKAAGWPEDIEAAILEKIR